MNRDEAMLLDEQERDCCECGICEVYDVEVGSFFNAASFEWYKKYELRCMGCGAVLDEYDDFDYWYDD